MKKSMRGEILGTLLLSALGIALSGAWLTHLYACFTTDRWGFLIAGAIFFPVAIMHGLGVWFGFWP